MTAILRPHSADWVTDQRLATAVAVELGYVGLSPASTLAETGHPVIGYDISDTRLANIKAGRVDLLASDRARLRRHGLGHQCASVPARKRTLP